MPRERVLLFPVDDTDDSQRAFDWMINNFYRDGDEVHLLNVISRLSFAATLGVPAVDFVPQINREAYEAAVRKAEAFIVKRFLGRLPQHIETTPIVHIIKEGGSKEEGKKKKKKQKGGGDAAEGEGPAAAPPPEHVPREEAAGTKEKGEGKEKVKKKGKGGGEAGSAGADAGADAGGEGIALFAAAAGKKAKKAKTKQ
ncbi:hypothetical protein TSOC_004009 [Tetrabaena socialis]|uniref:UspA domain-containing protein n=1 Tax=Tetrabaena socialis TaxID=47790 RepID=A0A2J8AA17_9CHLO|nr:hypothetical protein TSOC_004009 [Tetrabaena socialis]|eukprot:PNH09362.1 hypothetical protein TSOC_004009 [Tetrabaena socialis]